MDIPLNAEVHCADGVCGRSICLIIHPLHQSITHVAVETKGFLHEAYLVPLEWIVRSDPHHIYLRCTRAELAQCDPFRRVEFLTVDDAAYVSMSHLTGMGSDDAMFWPYVVSGTGEPGMYVDIEQIPPDELGIHRGAHVEATDGRIGRVDEFLINPENNHISHLVLREGHLWGQKDVTIPLSAIARIEDDVVYLKLNKQAIKSLPAIPVRRWRYS